MRIFCLFNLKPGTSVAEYEAWARASDLPSVNELAAVQRFSIHRATGMLGDEKAKPPYAYIEIIDIEGMDAFMADVASDKMAALATEFQGFAEAPMFIVTEEI